MEASTYRVATVRDAAFISCTVISSWQDAYRDFLPWSFLASLDRDSHHDPGAWESRIKEPASMTWIISDAGHDVGVLRIVTGASSIPDTDSELTRLYLLRHARGRGLGSGALAYARDEASWRAAPVLGICVLAGNKRGKRFCERLGARRLAERVAFRVNEEAIVEVMYEFRPVGEQKEASGADTSEPTATRRCMTDRRPRIFPSD